MSNEELACTYASLVLLMRMESSSSPEKNATLIKVAYATIDS